MQQLQKAQFGARTNCSGRTFYCSRSYCAGGKWNDCKKCGGDGRYDCTGVGAWQQGQGGKGKCPNGDNPLGEVSTREWNWQCPECGATSTYFQWECHMGQPPAMQHCDRKNLTCTNCQGTGHDGYTPCNHLRGPGDSHYYCDHYWIQSDTITSHYWCKHNYNGVEHAT